MKTDEKNLLSEPKYEPVKRYYIKKDEYSDIEVGERFRSWRLFNKLSMKEIADVVGVSIPTICRYEKGETPITILALTKLHIVYGIDCNWLLFGAYSRKRDIMSALWTSDEEARIYVMQQLWLYFVTHDSSVLGGNVGYVLDKPSSVLSDEVTFPEMPTHEFENAHRLRGITSNNDELELIIQYLENAKHDNMQATKTEK